MARVARSERLRTGKRGAKWIDQFYLGHSSVLPKEEYEKLVAKVFHIDIKYFDQLSELRGS